jgi:ABC-type transport system involved in multi-copper enzyme maturation permease subunit
MNAPRARSRWPLVGKELAEQAARKRTYVLRALYAAALFAAFILVFHAWMRNAGHDPAQLIGRGRLLFDKIVLFQFIGVFLFLPAMMCSAITAEKERDSLALLLLTDLTPQQIIREKYVGRLIPMLVYLLLSMPLMALAYAMGGVAADDILWAVYFVFLTCLQVGAIALMFSAWCRTTVGAFVATYLVGGLLNLVPFMCPMELYLQGERRTAMLPALVASVAVWASIFLFLALARRYLLTRAVAPTTNRLLNFFRRLDRFWHGVNQNFGGVVLVRESHELPGAQPVYWRETQRRALGKLNYLFRVLIAIEGPVALIGLTTAFMGSFRGDEAAELSVMMAVVWGIALLAVVARSADLVAAERSAQTLETLLTTPLTGAEVLREKMLSVYRLILVLSVPILTTALIEAHVESELYHGARLDYVPYLLGSIASVFIYLPLLAWVSLWIGLKMHSRVRAIIVALLVTAGWWAAPLVAMVFFDFGFRVSYGGQYLYHNRYPQTDVLGGMLMYLSPATAVAGAELAALRLRITGVSHEAVLTVNYLFYAAILLAVRWWVLRRADALLGRQKITGRLRRGEAAPPADGVPGSAR